MELSIAPAPNLAGVSRRRAPPTLDTSLPFIRLQIARIFDFAIGGTLFENGVKQRIEPVYNLR
jgi:hypothetical protein